MSTSDRREYLTATVLDQALLDRCQDNLDNGLHMIVEIQTPYLTGTYSSAGNIVTATIPQHGLFSGQFVNVILADDSDLFGSWLILPGATAGVFSFDAGAVPSPTTGTIGIDKLIYASDRNKYVGTTFYEAISEFPVIKRSLGEWLSPEIEFSRLQVAISNVDGRFNTVLAGGARYGGWIGNTVVVKVGLQDVASTYTTIYSGRVTDIGGVQRDRTRINLLSRDDFDRVNKNFPDSVFTQTNFPDIDENLIGAVVPIIYGDWTVELRETKLVPGDPASPVEQVPIVPAFPVNGLNAGVLAGTTSLQVIVSEHDLTYFDTAGVYLKRGDAFYNFNAADVSIVSGNRVVDLKQAGNGGLSVFDGSGYQYANGDAFFVKVKGKDLGAYDDNIVWQARDILLTYGGVTSGEIDANWATFRDKATPAESAIASFKSRVWVQEPQGVMTYVLSLLEQVRLEAFVSRDLKFKISSLHLDSFQASPSFMVRNWDIAAGSFVPQLDDRNAWNRAQAAYNFEPARNQNSRETSIFRNSAAITQAGKDISKKLVFPNLYESLTVTYQLKEMLKLASGYAEFIEATLTPRAMLKDLGDFVSINVNMGSTILENVPAMIRDIGYDPKGLQIPVRLWSFQMIPFPGYSPGYSGIVGGSTASITEET